MIKGYPGVAGMYILKTASFEEAEELCKQEPLVLEGYATYKLHAPILYFDITIWNCIFMGQKRSYPMKI